MADFGKYFITGLDYKTKLLVLVFNIEKAVFKTYTRGKPEKLKVWKF